MAELLKKIGYGQVEKNRIQGIRAGRVLADVPVNADVVAGLKDRIENGYFLAVDFGKGFKGNLKTGELVLPVAESTIVGLVYNETK